MLLEIIVTVGIIIVDIIIVDSIIVNSIIVMLFMVMVTRLPKYLERKFKITITG